ncbi:MAG: hypothetical protein VXW58_00910 [Pseudomonadota bacterium]|nr:hypothetical protein [Pseudomonadota bacterium]
MSAETTRQSHGALFELLRQQGLSRQAAHRAKRPADPQRDAQDSHAFLERAIASWGRPTWATQGPVDGAVSGAAKARSHNEFFRAIRA